jgi:uncharacterized membrane protein YccC
VPGHAAAAVAVASPRRRDAWAAIARREWQQVARIVIVAGVSWQICVWLGATAAPVFAVIVPLVSLRDDPFSAFNVSFARLIGVVSGLVIGFGVVQLLDPDVLAVVLLLVLSLGVGMVLRIGNTLNIQVAVSALLVFVSPEADVYGLTRLWETAVGTVVTVALTPFLFPANPLTAARAEIAVLTDGLVRSVRDAVRLTGSSEVEEPERIRGLVDVVGRQDCTAAGVRALAGQIATARSSARWSVLRRRELRAVADLDATRGLIEQLSFDVRSFAEDSMTFAGRAGYATDPQLSRPELDRIAEPLAHAMPLALTGRAFEAVLRDAHLAIQEFRVTEHSHLASVVRRPLHRMVEQLERFADAADSEGMG